VFIAGKDHFLKEIMELNGIKEVIIAKAHQRQKIRL